MKKILICIISALIILNLSACTTNQADNKNSILDVDSVRDFTYSTLDNEVKSENETKLNNDVNVEDNNSLLESFVLLKRADVYDTFCTGASLSPEDYMAVNIAGKEYKGSYSDSFVSMFYEGDVIYYKPSPNTEFGINADTGRLEFFYDWEEWDNSKYICEETDIYKIALDFIRSVEPDFNLSLYEKQCYIYDEARGRTYEYNFVKYINNIRTADSISVTVRNYGHVVSYSSFSLGLFDDMNVPTINVKQIIEDSESKLLLAARGARSAGLTNVSLPIRYILNDEHEIRLVRLKDGSYAFEVNVDVWYVHLNQYSDIVYEDSSYNEQCFLPLKD